MTFQEFDKLFDGLFAQCRKMRDTKGKEYANTATDRLANFKDIANELGIITIGDVRRALTKVGWHPDLADDLFAELKPNAKAVLLVYLMKHIRSIEAWVKNGEISSNERIEGRIVDAMTYLGLLWGLEVDSTDPGPVDPDIPKGKEWRANFVDGEQAGTMDDKIDDKSPRRRNAVPQSNLNRLVGRLDE